MIIRKRPSGWKLFFILRGSILPKVIAPILATILVAGVVAIFHEGLVRYHLLFTPVPFTIIGLALSIFLGFRNSAAYDRYWEGRRLWGELIIATRTLARQAFSLLASESEAEELARLRRRMVYGAIAFAHALRHYLRGTDAADDLQPLLAGDRLPAVLGSSNRPYVLLRHLSDDLSEGLQRGWISAPLAVNIDHTLHELDRVLAGCERIRFTPIPFSYSLLLHRTAYLYCFLLPFGLIDTVGVLTPLVVGLVSYTFFGLDALGDEIEEPFGLSANDLSLSAMGRTIEINLREALGEADLPEPILPEAYYLA